MSKVKNPQEKKRLIYEKDRRNCYGENDKSSRKNIRRNKKLRSRHFRSSSAKLTQLTSHKIEEGYAQELESELRSSEKLNRLKGFKKVADHSLKDHIKNQNTRRQRRYGRRENS